MSLIMVREASEPLCHPLTALQILVYPDTFLYITFFFNLSRRKPILAVSIHSTEVCTSIFELASGYVSAMQYVELSRLDLSRID